MSILNWLIVIFLDDNSLFNINSLLLRLFISLFKSIFSSKNLEFGHKCRKSNKLFQKSVGFEPGSDEYKKCVLNKGVIIND